MAACLEVWDHVLWRDHYMNKQVRFEAIQVEVGFKLQAGTAQSICPSMCYALACNPGNQVMRCGYGAPTGPRAPYRSNTYQHTVASEHQHMASMEYRGCSQGESEGFDLGEEIVHNLLEIEPPRWLDFFVHVKEVGDGADHQVLGLEIDEHVHGIGYVDEAIHSAFHRTKPELAT